MAQNSKSRKLDQYIVRFPDGMRDELKELAEEHNRSLNAEILARLEDYQKLDERLYEITIINQVLRDSNEGLRDIKKKFSKIKSQFFDEDDKPRPLISVPQDLLDRIQQAARRNHRDVEGEVIATLEEAYPPRDWAIPDLEMTVLQWYLDGWHLVEWEAWSRFRSGEPSPQITDKMTEKDNYFVVVVFDDFGLVCNIIRHSYVYRDGKFKSPAFDYLSPDEIEEYSRYMTAITATDEDEARLRELQRKMEPAFALPSNSVQALRAALAVRSPQDVVDKVLVSRGILSPSAA